MPLHGTPTSQSCSANPTKIIIKTIAPDAHDRVYGVHPAAPHNPRTTPPLRRTTLRTTPPHNPPHNPRTTVGRMTLSIIYIYIYMYIYIYTCVRAAHFPSLLDCHAACVLLSMCDALLVAGTRFVLAGLSCSVLRSSHALPRPAAAHG